MEILNLKTLTREKAIEIIRDLIIHLDNSYIARVAKNEDAPNIVKADKEAWGEEELSATEQLIQSRIEKFAIGTWVLISPENKISGSFSGLLIDYNIEEIKSWEQCTANGTIANHKPDGDCLFGVNISVIPEASGLGLNFIKAVTDTLMMGLKLKYVAAGGRLDEYHKFSSQMSIKDYILSVEIDPEKNPFTPMDHYLDFLLRYGCKIRKIIPGYWGKDAASCGYGVLVTIENPYWDLLNKV